MPILHFSADLQAEEERATRLLFDNSEPYMAPLYKYAIRQDRYIVCKSVPLSSGPAHDAAHWTLRSVALMLNHAH
eukprot:6323466-Prorocentrum_lima.AAC.1